jgi:sterol 14-demethylase
MSALAELTILTASSCLMGKEIRENLFEQVADLYHDLDNGITPLSVFFPNAPIPVHFKRNKARLEMVKLFGKVIADRREAGVKHDDVLQHFMDAKYRNMPGMPARHLTDVEITGLMIALLFAGQHTSSITSCWTILKLAESPELLARARSDISSHVEEYGLGYDAINNMDFLHQCVKEVLRMYPPLVFLMRKALKPIPVGDHVIPKGDIIAASPAVSMRLEEAFTNPTQYDPDRFLPPREEHKKAPYTFIGFGGGLHGCMGEQFGYLQVKTVVSTIFQNFDIELINPCPEPDYTMMVVGPRAPVMVRYKRRR